MRINIKGIVLVNVMLATALASLEVQAKTTLTWRGRTWDVTEGPMAGVVPGSASNVYVDAQGLLHMRVQKYSKQWGAAELFTANRMGFGSYLWHVEGALDQMDKSIVFSVFPYGPADGIGVDGEDALITSFSKWNYEVSTNAGFTFMPATSYGKSFPPANKSFNVNMNGGTYITIQLNWTPTEVEGTIMGGFQALNSKVNVFNSFKFDPSSPYQQIPQTEIPLGMNLWSYKVKPTASQEVIVHDFQFVPYNPSGATPATPVPSATPAPSVQKVVGGYFPNWKGYAKSIVNFNPAYNTLFLFNARPTGGGSINFDISGLGSNFINDCKAYRAMGKKLILTVGGSGFAFNLNSRQESNQFLASFNQIYTQLGGLDGLDWNNYEGTLPSTNEMIYVSGQLKKLYGSKFTISTPPAPWRSEDLSLAVAMNQAGVLDWVGPQFYDSPGLVGTSNLLTYLPRWINALGQGKVVIGYGISDASGYWTAAQAVDSLRTVMNTYPNIRGIFDWEVTYDNANGNPFANIVAPIMTTPPAKP